MTDRRITVREPAGPKPVATGDPVRPRWPWLLSNSGVLTATATVAGIGVAALVVMLVIAGHALNAERPGLQIEALKYGLGFFAAGGAVAALLLAVRRQLLAEHTHALSQHTLALSERNHQLALLAQRHTETDAAERRVTDLYTKASEQLGHADAAVRTAGLYSLERVAQNNPGQRQTIVNVLCAYLRMPYTPAASAESIASLPRAGAAAAPQSRDPNQEIQVRLTAQRILTSHLIPAADYDPAQADDWTLDPQVAFWPEMDLDLSGAHLTDWNMHSAYLHTARFSKATFTGTAWFSKVTFTQAAWFGGAAFTSGALFNGAAFTGVAWFGEATFTGDALFNQAAFTDAALFNGATFTGDAQFDGITTADRRHVSVNGARVAVRPGRGDVWPPGVQVVTDTDEFSRLAYVAATDGRHAGGPAQTLGA